MEDLNQSSMKKSLCSMEGTASGEESGWTMYFEDFWESQKRETSGCCSGDGGSSMISDAASCVAWKPMVGVGASESCKKLSFKKRMAKRAMDDDDPLEDTASSPVNSPKVSDLIHLNMNPRKKDGQRVSSQEKDGGCENLEEVRKDELDGFGFIEGTNECSELKKKGLCLVPLSMLVDYLG